MNVMEYDYKGYRIYYWAEKSEMGYTGKGKFYLIDSDLAINQKEYYIEHYFATDKEAKETILSFLKLQIENI